VCKQALLVDHWKIVVIVNLPPPKSVHQLKSTLGHTCYYRKFIKGYAQIIVTMEKLFDLKTLIATNSLVSTLTVFNFQDLLKLTVHSAMLCVFHLLN
jgi:hypothetical protein